LQSVAVLRCGKTVLRCGFVAVLRVIYVHTAIAVRIRNIAAASRDAVCNLKPWLIYFNSMHDHEQCATFQHIYFDMMNTCLFSQERQS
jgi:hypothetical protein